MGTGDFIIIARSFDQLDAAGLIEQVQQYYVHLYGGRDPDSTDPGEFAPPDGLFLVGYLDGAAVACGGWRRHSAHAVEVKRMYVAEPVRGRGLARLLLAELERRAAAAGAVEVVLNTGSKQTEAIELYESSGYVRTEYRYGVHAEHGGALFFTKALRDDRE